MGEIILPSERPDPPAEIRTSALKVLFSALPVVGPVLSELLFDCRSRIKQERVLLTLREATRDLEETKIDFEFLKSDECGDLLEDILQKVAVNNSEAKRAYFKNLLTKVIHGHPAPDLSRTFINILGEITESELLLLSQFYKIRAQGIQLQKEGKEVDLYVYCTKEKEEIFGIFRSQYLLLVQSLIRKGLLCDDSGGRFDSSPYDVVGINELGVQFYEHISHA